MPKPPELVLDVPKAVQGYSLEIWCEKTTMNDILLPIAEQYGASIITGMGEMSVTHCNLLVERAKADGRPVRIFYISDFDPAGQSMPVAVARKIEFFLYDGEHDLDIQLRPVVLTKEQCVEYDLPPLKIKASEKRGEAFEERHDVEGYTELDALEASRPGELTRILEDEIDHFYDADVDGYIDTDADSVREELEEINDRIHEQHKADIKRVRDAYAAWLKQAKLVWRAIETKLKAESPDLPDWTEPDDGNGDDEALYDSTRFPADEPTREGYIDQIEHYKAFQGKAMEYKRVYRNIRDDEGGPVRTGDRYRRDLSDAEHAARAKAGNKSSGIILMMKRKNGCTVEEVEKYQGCKGTNLRQRAERAGYTLKVEKRVGQPTRYYAV
jgi:hypothetical protein